MTDNINITFHDTDDLTPYQKAIIQKIYNKAKHILSELDSISSINEALSITIAITNLAQLLERIKINNTPLSGENKCKIVLYLGKKILLDIIPTSSKETFTTLYDTIAEQTLHKLIDFANNNKMIQSVTIEENENVIVDTLPSRNCCVIC